MSDSARRVVIVGGGFGGLAAAKALRKTDAQVVLVDRQNHHLFQPLLYQVATSLLSPGCSVGESLSRRLEQAGVRHYRDREVCSMTLPLVTASLPTGPTRAGG